MTEVKEEKKVAKNEAQEPKKKMTYEDLKNLTIQISQQAQKLKEENNKLKEALIESNMENSYTQLNFAFKYIELCPEGALIGKVRNFVNNAMDIICTIEPATDNTAEAGSAEEK